MDKRVAEAWREHKAAEHQSREIEGIIHRVCEALSGTCVMIHEYPRGSPHYPACNIENCAAYRAAHSAPEGQS